MSNGSVTTDQILNTQPGSVTGTMNVLALAVACAISEESAHSLDYLDNFIESNSDLIQFGLFHATRSAHSMVETLVNGQTEEYVVENIYANMPQPAYALDASFCLARELIATDFDDLDFFFAQLFDQVSRDFAIQSAVVGLIVLIFLTIRFGADEGLKQFFTLSATYSESNDIDAVLNQLHELLTTFENKLLFATVDSFEEGAMAVGLLEEEQIPRLLGVIDPFSNESISLIRDS